MSLEQQDWQDTREMLLRLLPMSSSMAGLCIAAIGLFRFTEKSVRVSTIADDILAVAALLFLLSSYLSFWALRTSRPARARVLANWVDAIFLFALTALVAVGFMILYTVL